MAGIQIDGANQKLYLDSDADTYLEAATDDIIKVYVSGAEDLRIGANAINVLSGTTLTIDSGATIANSGTATGFGAVTALNNATANELVTVGSTTTELDAESTLTFDGSALVVGGTAPSITIGDAGAEDTKLVFDGNAQDFYIGLDDSADDLLIGLGSTVGTTPAISIDENLAVKTYGDITMTGTTPVLTIGDAGAEDTAIVFDGNAQDFYIGLDDSADDLVIGLGSSVGTTPAISINEDRDVTISDGAIDFDIASHDTSNGLKLGGTLVTATAAELNIMDGVTSTAAEINLIDGGTARGTTALASGDGILVNDAGTMRMTNVDTVGAYIGSGHIAQVVSATRTAAQSLTSTTYTAATGLTVDITPSSASSKILIFVSLGTINATDGAAEGINAKIYKDGSALTFFASNLGYNSASTSVARNFHSSFVFQNAPATTSSVTYSLYFACAGSNTIQLQTGSSVGTFTCMEILP